MAAMRAFISFSTVLRRTPSSEDLSNILRCCATHGYWQNYSFNGRCQWFQQLQETGTSFVQHVPRKLTSTAKIIPWMEDAYWTEEANGSNIAEDGTLMNT
ncbi:unnamed protein product, partial [Cyprideis torosa]